MRKSRKLFPVFFILGTLMLSSGCSEDVTMNELMETIDKYEITDQNNVDAKDKPPTTGG